MGKTSLAFLSAPLRVILALAWHSLKVLVFERRSAQPALTLQREHLSGTKVTDENVFAKSATTRKRKVLVFFTHHNLRWLWRNAQRSEQSCQNGEGLPIQVYGDRNLFVRKSKPACLHTRGAREKSGTLNINIPMFLTLPEERVQLNIFEEKSWGHRPFWDFFFKKPLFPIASHTKAGMLFGQHFDGELPRNLNHVLLRHF